MDSCKSCEQYDEQPECATVARCLICMPGYTPKISVENGPVCNHNKNCVYQKFTEKVNIAFPGPVTNCEKCGVEFLKTIPRKYLVERHWNGDKNLLLFSLKNIKIVSAPKSVETTYCCNFCNTHFLEDKVLDHVGECQSACIILLNQISNRLRTDLTKTLDEDSCNVCSEKFHPSMLVSHAVDRHPETMSLCRQIFECVLEHCDNSLLDCATCKVTVLKENSKDHLRQYHPEHCWLLDEFETKIDPNVSSSNQNHHPSERNETEIVVPKKVQILLQFIPWVASKKYASLFKKRTALQKHLSSVNAFKRKQKENNTCNMPRQLSQELYIETKNNKSFTLNQSSKIGKIGPKKTKKNILLQNTQRVASKKYLHFIKKRALFKRRSIKSFFIKNQRNEKSKSVEHESQITFVKLERLPSHIYQECINQGYIKITSDSGSSIESILTPQLNVQPNGLCNLSSTSLSSPLVENILFGKKKLNGNEITGEKGQRAKKEGNAEEVIEESEGKAEINGEEENVQKAEKEEISDDEIEILAIINLDTGEVIEEFEGKAKINRDKVVKEIGKRQNAENKKVNEDKISEKEKRQRKLEKEKVIKKMLKKYHEKEMKKQVLYWQKALTRYVIQHRDTLVQFEHNLMNARKYIKNQRHGKKFIKELNVIADVKIKKSVVYILQKLLDAMKKNVPLKKCHLQNALQGLEGLGQ